MDMVLKGNAHDPVVGEFIGKKQKDKQTKTDKNKRKKLMKRMLLPGKILGKMWVFMGFPMVCSYCR